MVAHLIALCPSSVNVSVSLWLCGKKRFLRAMPLAIETHLFVSLRNFVASCFLPPYSLRSRRNLGMCWDVW